MYNSRSEKTKSFVAVTQATSQAAQKCLAESGWDVERAVDYYFSNQHLFPAAKRGDRKKLDSLFSKYAEGDDEMTGDAMFRFMADVKVDAEAAESMGLCWKLNAEVMPIIRRKEFVDGFSAMGVSSVKGITGEMEKMRQQLAQTDGSAFKHFYDWVFGYCTGAKRKTIDTDAAAGLWALVLGHWKHTEAWCEFVLDEENGVKAVSKDLWQQLLLFSRAVSDDFSNYDADSSAWPFFIDAFVEHMNEQKGKGKGGSGSDDDDDDE